MVTLELSEPLCGILKIRNQTEANDRLIAECSNIDISECINLLLHFDEANFDSNNKLRIRLLQTLFKCCIFACESLQPPPVNDSTDSTVHPAASTPIPTTAKEQISPQLLAPLLKFCAKLVPVLLWLHVSLPKPKEASMVSSLQEDSHMISLLTSLQECIESLEGCMVGINRLYAIMYSDKLESKYRASHLGASYTSSIDMERVKLFQTMLERPSIYCRKPIYEPLAGRNPNTVKARVSHTIADPALWSRGADEHIDAITPTTKPQVFESLLKLFESQLGISNLKIEMPVDCILIMVLFIERILCTGFSNSPVQFQPDFSASMLAALPMPIQKFHRLSMFVWQHICESFRMVASPITPIPASKLAHRFSISSNHSIGFGMSGATGGSRKYSEHNNNNNSNANDHLMSSLNAAHRPFTAASTNSSAPYPQMTQPPQLRRSQNALNTLGTSFNTSATSMGRNSIGAGTAAAVPLTIMTEVTTAASPLKMNMKSSLCVDFEPRMVLQRDTMRVMLSIVQFAAQYFAAYSPGAAGPHSNASELLKRKGMVAAALASSVPTGRDPTITSPLSASFSGSASLNQSNQSPVEYVDFQGIWKRILMFGSSSSAKASMATDDEPIGIRSPNAIGDRMEFSTVFDAAVKRSVRALYQRATYEMIWEISMGARCLLVDISPSSVIYTADSTLPSSATQAKTSLQPTI